MRSRSISASWPTAAARSSRRSCRSATAAWAANASTTRRSSAAERVSAQHQRDVVLDQDVRVALGRGEAGLVADRGGDPPGGRVVLHRRG